MDKINLVILFAEFFGAALTLWGGWWAFMKWALRPLKEFFTKIFVEDRAKLDFVVKELKNNGGGSLRDLIEATRDGVFKLERRQQIRGNLGTLPEFETDAFGNLIFVNRACTRFYGVTERELLGYQWKQWVHEDDQDKVEEKIRESIKHGTDFKSYHRIVTSSGEIKYVFAEALALKDKDGKVFGYVGNLALQHLGLEKDDK